MRSETICRHGSNRPLACEQCQVVTKLDKGKIAALTILGSDMVFSDAQYRACINDLLAHVQELEHEIAELNEYIVTNRFASGCKDHAGKTTSQFCKTCGKSLARPSNRV